MTTDIEHMLTRVTAAAIDAPPSVLRSALSAALRVAENLSGDADQHRADAVPLRGCPDTKLRVEALEGIALGHGDGG